MEGTNGEKWTNLLKLRLLPAREVKHLLCALEKHRTLRLRLRNVEGGREDGNLGLLDLFDDTYAPNQLHIITILVPRTFWFPTEDHPADNRATSETPAHDLHHTHVINVEVLRVGRHHDKRCLCY